MAGVPLGKENALHLLRRAGAGHKGLDLKRFSKLDRDRAARRLIEVDPILRPGPKRDMDAYQAWWLRKMRLSGQALREKMTLFWHDHFAVSQLAIGFAQSEFYTDLMRRHIQKLRFYGMWDPAGRRGGGTFRNLLFEVTRDPAMLYFLNGNLNTAYSPNENYGRELMELFTLGVKDLNGQPNYTQQDVVEISRALTGFDDVGGFVGARFDSGMKTLFAGKPFEASGNLGVVVPVGYATPEFQVPLPPERNVLDILLAHRDSDNRPTAARFISKKLWEWFAYPAPDKALVDELADAFVASNYTVSELLRAIFTHDEFYSDRAKISTVKNPVEFALQTIRALHVSTRSPTLAHHVGEMGMELLAPPTVDGWRSGPSWVAAGPWLARLQFAQRLAAGREWREGYKFNPMTFIPEGATDPAQVIDAFIEQLGVRIDPSIESTVRDALVQYFEGANDFSDPESDAVQRKVRGLVVLLLTLPEFHVH
jgi:uncharacterized protein (DUF1800 family)